MVGFHHHDPLTPTQKILAGMASGCFTRLVTQPIDVVKIRTQLQKSSKKDTHLRLILGIIKYEGLKGFFSGHSLGQMHSIIAMGTQFYCYEVTTMVYKESAFSSHLQFRPIALLCCGIISGCIAATVVCPLEVIRVRQMVDRKQYKGIIQGAKGVYNAGGIRAFYEGLSASVLQVGPSTGLAFTIFAYVQKSILKHLKKPEKKADDPHSSHGHDASNILLASSVAGVISGFIAKTVTYPLDLAKRRLQISSHPRASDTKGPKLLKCDNLVDCIKAAYKYDGIPGLFKGYSITIYKAIVTNVVAFTSFELTCHLLREIKHYTN